MYLRLAILHSIIGNNERVQAIYKIMDIKSVQHDTLGFLYLNVALQYGFNENI